MEGTTLSSPGSRDYMKAIVFFVTILGLAGFFVYKQATQGGQPGVITVGQEAPDFVLKDEHGNRVKLSDYRGKLVFLHFWASWCPPCVDEAQDLERLKSAMKDKPFEMLAVSIDTEEDAVRDFDKRYHVTLPVIVDPGQQVARGLYKITGQPETFLISPKGLVLKHIVGPVAWSNTQVLARIDSMMPTSVDVSR